MTEENILLIVSFYLVNHKYTPERIDTSKLPQNMKAPDYKVKSSSLLKFYCEVKSPDLILNTKVKLFTWQTTVSKLRDLIHKAVKQFNDQDPGHSVPWVLVFTSSHMQLNWTNLEHCIQGKVGYGGQLIKDLTQQRFIQDTNQDVKDIDLFIWCQINDKQKRICQMIHHINPHSKLFTETVEVSKKLIPYAGDEIMDKYVKKYV